MQKSKAKAKFVSRESSLNIASDTEKSDLSTHTFISIQRLYSSSQSLSSFSYSDLYSSQTTESQVRADQ
jgi:hypothetical protein